MKTIKNLLIALFWALLIPVIAISLTRWIHQHDLAMERAYSGK
jgi:hypothetical protein